MPTIKYLFYDGFQFALNKKFDISNLYLHRINGCWSINGKHALTCIIATTYNAGWS